MPKLVAPDASSRRVQASSRHRRRTAASSSCGPTGPSASARSRDIGDRGERRAAHFHARGLEEGRPPRDRRPRSATSSSSRSSARVFAGIVPVPIYPQLSFKNVEATTTRSRTSRTRRARRCSSRRRRRASTSSRCCRSVADAPRHRRPSTSSPAPAPRELDVDD